ncbi:MAG: uracil-DNA glycosylase family protein [Verrucomicrobiales bacterium]|jgi:hypothetical protein|nr:uracil-DNA glycosylase family protein [Verrucomicrobiales bacterium]
MDYKFEPWIGENYKNSHLRTMFVGESHYGEDTKKYRERTTNIVMQDVVKNIQGRHWGKCPFFGNMYKAMQNESVPQLRTRPNCNKIWQNFWCDIIFCNYLQTESLGGPRGRSKPESTDYEGAAEYLWKLIDDYKPRLIIFWSKGRIAWHFYKWINEQKASKLKNFEWHPAGEEEKWTDCHHFTKPFLFSILKCNHPSGRGFGKHEYERIEEFKKTLARC